MIIGVNGTLYLNTDYIDKDILDPSDLDERTFPLIFQRSDIYEESYYDAICRLWKPDNNQNISLICKLEPFSININYNIEIEIKETKFNYKEYTFIFISEENINVKMLEYTFPFLYSKEQIININEKNQEYSLSFQIVSYNNEDLFIYSESNYYAKLDNSRNYSNNIKM